MEIRNEDRFWRGQEHPAKLAALPIAICLLIWFAATSSAMASGEFEPNDIRDTAHGPLAGGTNYTATFETDNDVDWYVFYIKTYAQIDFSATMVKSTCSSYRRAYLRLYDKDGKEVDSFYPGAVNETNHLNLTMSPGRYYLEVEKTYWEACTGDRYRFRIDPASAITASRECGEAIVTRDSVGVELAAVNRDLERNGEVLSRKAQAVRKARAALREVAKEARRLKRQHRFTRWRRRQVGRARLRAKRQLERAKAARTVVWRAQTDLQTLAGNFSETIAGAEGQIATHC